MTRIICILRNSATFLSTLILKLSDEFEIMLKLSARYKTFAAQNGEFERFGGFCVDCDLMISLSS